MKRLLSFLIIVLLMYCPTCELCAQNDNSATVRIRVTANDVKVYNKQPIQLRVNAKTKHKKHKKSTNKNYTTDLETVHVGKVLPADTVFGNYSFVCQRCKERYKVCGITVSPSERKYFLKYDDKRTDGEYGEYYAKDLPTICNDCDSDSDIFLWLVIGLVAIFMFGLLVVATEGAIVNIFIWPFKMIVKAVCGAVKILFKLPRWICCILLRTNLDTSWKDLYKTYQDNKYRNEKKRWE